MTKFKWHFFHLAFYLNWIFFRFLKSFPFWNRTFDFDFWHFPYHDWRYFSFHKRINPNIWTRNLNKHKKYFFPNWFVIQKIPSKSNEFQLSSIILCFGSPEKMPRKMMNCFFVSFRIALFIVSLCSTESVRFGMCRNRNLVRPMDF